jgi:hypothetical protein
MEQTCGIPLQALENHVSCCLSFSLAGPNLRRVSEKGTQNSTESKSVKKEGSISCTIKHCGQILVLELIYYRVYDPRIKIQNRLIAYKFTFLSNSQTCTTLSKLTTTSEL